MTENKKFHLGFSASVASALRLGIIIGATGPTAILEAFRHTGTELTLAANLARWAGLLIIAPTAVYETYFRYRRMRARRLQPTPGD